MVWTEPKTWTTEPLLSSDLNAHLRDNLKALKDPPTAFTQVNIAANYSTTSGAWTEIDPDLALTLTTGGGDVLVGANLTLRHPNWASMVRGYFDLVVDGVALAGGDGLAATDSKQSNATSHISFVVMVRNLAAGTHTIRLYWKISGAGDMTLLCSNALSGLNMSPQFWAREVS